MNFDLFHLRVFSSASRIVLLLGICGILIGTLGIRLAEDVSWIKFFDNVHWTAGLLSAAILSWLVLRTTSPQLKPSRRWFAIGLSGYAIGQLLWDVQAVLSYNKFPAPSDLFYLWLGPCIAYGLLLELARLAKKRQKLPAMLDISMLSVSSLILVLVAYLPIRGEFSLLSLLVLIIYPVSLFLASFIGVIMTATLRLRITAHWLMFMFGLLTTGFCWMYWNLMALQGEAANGTWFNIIFSIAILLMAVGAGLWKSEQYKSIAYERMCEGFLRLLPLLTVLLACLAIVMINVLADVSLEAVRLVEYGAPLVIFMAAVKQLLMLQEREQLIRLRAALVREEQFSNDIIDSLPGVFCLLDDKGRVTSWNPRFAEVSGYAEHEIAGRDVLEFIHESHRNAIITKK